MGGEDLIGKRTRARVVHKFASLKRDVRKKKTQTNKETNKRQQRLRRRMINETLT